MLPCLPAGIIHLITNSPLHRFPLLQPVNFPTFQHLNNFSLFTIHYSLTTSQLCRFFGQFFVLYFQIVNLLALKSVQTLNTFYCHSLLSPL